MASCSRQFNGSRKQSGAMLPQKFQQFSGRNMAGQQVAGFWGTGIAGSEIKAEAQCRRQKRTGRASIQAAAVVADVNPAEVVVSTHKFPWDDKSCGDLFCSLCEVGILWRTDKYLFNVFKIVSSWSPCNFQVESLSFC